MKKVQSYFLVVGFLVLQGTAYGADRDVCSTCTYTTIQSAISAATPGDRIRVTQGTYNERPFVTNTITLSGGWNPSFTGQVADPSLTVVDGGNTERCILINPVPDVEITMENLTSSQSAIRDTDFAVETSKLTRGQILVNVANSVLSIANNTPQNVLALLGG